MQYNVKWISKTPSGRELGLMWGVFLYGLGFILHDVKDYVGSFLPGSPGQDNL